ncbi:MAG TPA: DNA-protecting protein DprA, partial [Firmicutes bacterium]|nr:DNA-protecting protein DprA [Bacillota bacterium]
MSGRELWLAVAGTPGIGARSFFQLLESFGHLEDFWRASETEIRERLAPFGARRLQALLAARESFHLEETLRALERAQAHFVTLLDPDYPDNLKTIFDPPPVLYYRGELKDSDALAVAVVGSRRASPY